jgi:hypothetical protein
MNGRPSLAGVLLLPLSRSGTGQLRWPLMERNARFEQSRFLGDKRTQFVYDLDSWDDEAIIHEIVELDVALSFAPDTLPEARNRGYTLAKPGAHRIHRKPRA